MQSGIAETSEEEFAPLELDLLSRKAECLDHWADHLCACVDEVLQHHGFPVCPQETLKEKQAA